MAKVAEKIQCMKGVCNISAGTRQAHVKKDHPLTYADSHKGNKHCLENSDYGVVTKYL